MSSDQNDKGQLVLDFGSSNKEALSFDPGKQNRSSGLFLIVNNVATGPTPVSAETNSSEITRIIRSVGNSLGW